MTAAFDDRTAAGRDRDAAVNVLGSMSRVEAPCDLVSVVDLVEKLGKANKAVAGHCAMLSLQPIREKKIAACRERIEQMKDEIETDKSAIHHLLNDIDSSAKVIEAFEAPDINAIKQQIGSVEETNDAVRNNIKYDEQARSVDTLKASWSDVDIALSKVRHDRQKLLAGVKMPLEGLGIEDGELIYNGCKWDCMSSTEQLKVATSIVRELNPDCGFVLLDKLEQMDVQTMHEFGDWAKEHGLQIIATRVSTGDECSLVIEDGQVMK